MHTPRRRALALIIACTAIGGALVAPNVQAAPTPSVATACPTDSFAVDAFDDVSATSSHGVAIDCLVWWEITGGTSTTTYSPGKAITREQIATMLARLLTRTGEHPGTVPSAGFTDVKSTSVHKLNIDALAHLGIVTGSDGLFRPGNPVTRAQMATMLVRMLENVYGQAVVADGSFTDIAGNTHASNILKLVGAGVTGGTTATEYSPGRSVTRDQMASFVMRSADVLVRAGAAQRPLRGKSSAYTYMGVDASGKPGRFDPATPISYVINPANAPATGVTEVREAFRRVAAATGLQFVDAGTSNEVPHLGWGPLNADGSDWAPILVAWTAPGASDMLTTEPGLLGQGGPLLGLTTSSGVHYVTGAVAIHATNAARLPSGFGPGSQGALFMHEIGHVVGLHHPSDTPQLMYATLSTQPGVWGAGDIAGLATVGLAAGLRSDVPEPHMLAGMGSLSNGGDTTYPEMHRIPPVADYLPTTGHDDHEH